MKGLRTRRREARERIAAVLLASPGPHGALEVAQAAHTRHVFTFETMYDWRKAGWLVGVLEVVVDGHRPPRTLSLVTDVGRVELAYLVPS